VRTQDAVLLCRGEYVVVSVSMFTLLALSLILRSNAHYIYAHLIATSCHQGLAALRKGHATPLCINFATQVAAVFITEPPKTDSLLVVVYTIASSNSTTVTESNGALQETALLMPVRSTAAASILGAMPAWKVSVDNFNIPFNSHTSFLS
jgi:membrane glycosyltransferase